MKSSVSCSHVSERQLERVAAEPPLVIGQWNLQGLVFFLLFDMRIANNITSNQKWCDLQDTSLCLGSFN